MKFVNFVDELTRLQPFLYRFAYSLTKNHEAAKDLLQETLLKTLENREKFIEDTNLRAWMCAIMKNTFINDYRKLLLAHESVCRIDDLKSEPCMIDGTDAGTMKTNLGGKLSISVEMDGNNAVAVTVTKK